MIIKINPSAAMTRKKIFIFPLITVTSLIKAVVKALFGVNTPYGSLILAQREVPCRNNKLLSGFPRYQGKSPTPDFAGLKGSVMQSLLIKLVFLVCWTVLPLFAGPLAGVAAEHHPFKPGEKLHFVLKYGAIPAGVATLQVDAMDAVEDVEAYHFIMTARSNAFIDLFFKVRDRIDSYADVAMNRSLFYRKDQKEGKTRKNIRVEFDWQKNESSYVNFDSKPRVLSLLPGTFDPLSVFYYSRLLDFEKKDTFEHPVTDGKKNMMGILRLLGRETVSVPAGTFDTLVLEPDLQKVEGVFSKKQRARIKLWVTDDERRLLVQMKSQAVVGSFVAELVEVEGTGPVKVSNLEKTE